MKAQKLLTVAAGDNVVRLLPPLIAGEAEVNEAIGMIDRACAKLAAVQSAPKKDAVA
jgi:acetylornithine/N-succinyldiaminopimelate aminotransferase